LALSMDLVSTRRINFMGEVLKHHTAQSSKFFGMWIQEKNKD